MKICTSTDLTNPLHSRAARSSDAPWAAVECDAPLEAPHSGLVGGRVLGEIAWPISQSARHSEFRVTDLGWFVMPSIQRRNFHLFCGGDRPVGVVLQAFSLVDREGHLAARCVSVGYWHEKQDWSGGDGLWLVDLVAPFATQGNRRLELMFTDLLVGPFKGCEFHMLSRTSEGKKGQVIRVGKGANGELMNAVVAGLSGRARAVNLMTPAVFTCLTFILSSCVLSRECAPFSGYNEASVSDLECSARAGDKLAQLELGIRYEEGVGIAADPRLAEVWFERAAQTVSDHRYAYSPPVGRERAGKILQLRGSALRPGLPEAERRLRVLRSRKINRR